MSTKLSFLTTPIQPQLKEGAYDAQLLAIEEVVPDTGTSYVKFTYKLTGLNNRELKDVRGEKATRAMLSSLRQQLGRQFDQIVPIDFCNELIKEKTPFKIWLLKETNDGKSYNNIYFYDKHSLVTVVPASAPAAVITETPFILD